MIKITNEYSIYYPGFKIGILHKLKDLKATSQKKKSNDEASDTKTRHDNDDDVDDIDKLSKIKNLMDFIVFVHIHRMSSTSSRSDGNSKSIKSPHTKLSDELSHLRFAKDRNVSELHDSVNAIASGVQAVKVELKAIQDQQEGGGGKGGVGEFDQDIGTSENNNYSNNSNNEYSVFVARLTEFVASSESCVKSLLCIKAEVMELISQVMRFVGESSSTSQGDVNSFEEIINVLWSFSCEFDRSIMLLSAD